MWFEQNGTDNEFMQCMPDYPKPENFFKKLFGLSKETVAGISSYTFEVSTGEKIYTSQVEIFHNYYLSHKLPDISDWQDSGII